MIADISTNIPSLMVWTMTACRYVAATLVEHAAVNRRVVGSSPTGGAIHMYAYVDGEFSVGIGVYFLY